MALVTASDFAYQAIRRCGHLRPGYMPSPELLSDCMDAWTIKFDAWNAERTLNYTIPDYVFAVTGSGHGTTGNGQTFGGAGYQIGTGAPDFNVPRPTEISKINLYLTSTNPAQPSRIPMRKLHSIEEWGSITVPNLTPINVATCYFYDKQFPYGVIWVWPPLNGNSLEIFGWGTLIPPASLAADYSAPPGYADAIIWTLAEAVWPLCTLDIMPHKHSFQQISGFALAARQKIKALNAPKPLLQNDFGSHRGTDSLTMILTGDPY